AVRDGNEVETGFGFAGETVVGSDGFVGDDEVGLNEIAYGEVVGDQMAQELGGFAAELRAGIEGEFGEALAIRLQDLELVELEPLGGELFEESGEARVSDEARGLGVELGFEFTGSG